VVVAVVCAGAGAAWGVSAGGGAGVGLVSAVVMVPGGWVGWSGRVVAGLVAGLVLVWGGGVRLRVVRWWVSCCSISAVSTCGCGELSRSCLSAVSWSRGVLGRRSWVVMWVRSGLRLGALGWGWCVAG
jgi:hypothetical protein